MKVFHTIEEIRRQVQGIQHSGESVAIVPTMGSLHEGHLALVARAHEVADRCVVTIFVNPTQFGEGEDFDSYPRNQERDLSMLKAHYPDALIFAPSVSEMYPMGLNSTWVDNPDMAQYLCAASRPGHFRGVLTVVSKLFNACPADVAVFGLKDVQQFYLISKMVQDLNIDIRLEGVETTREKDGLALSSRNRNLSSDERVQAVNLYRAISAAKRAVSDGIRRGVKIEHRMRMELNKADLGRIDYVQAVLSTNLSPVAELQSGDTVIAAVAVYFQKARLIDNAIITIP
jgi:pantoate--beta-alanine ligase